MLKLSLNLPMIHCQGSKNVSAKLAPYVETICEFEDGYCAEAEIRGVSISHSNDVMGAVITALVPVSSAYSPVCINTPHLPADQYNDGGEAPVLPSGCVKIIKELIIEAEKYINGRTHPRQSNTNRV